MAPVRSHRPGRPGAGPATPRVQVVHHGHHCRVRDLPVFLQVIHCRPNQRRPVPGLEPVHDHGFGLAELRIVDSRARLPVTNTDRTANVFTGPDLTRIPRSLGPNALPDLRIMAG